MSSHDQLVKKRGEPVACPFCGQSLPRPQPLPVQENAPGDGSSGGHCQCSALYLLDASGRQGGEVLLEGLTLLCAGDLAAAMQLRADVDYDLISRVYNSRGHCFENAPAHRSAYGIAKLWFFRRRPPAPVS